MIVDGLSVQLLAGPALRLQQHSGVGSGDFLRQGLDLGGGGGDGHDVVKGVFRAVGPADAAQDLTAAPLHGLQLLPGLIGVLQEGDHGEAAGQDSVLIDGVEIDEIEVLDLLPGDVEDGRSRLQHIRKPRAGPQVPQPVALDLADIAPGLFVQKIPIGPVSKDDAALGVDDGDALPHGVEGGAGGGVELHRLPSFLCCRCIRL